MNSKGLSLVEVLVAIVLFAIVTVAFTTLVNSLARENRQLSDRVESVDLESQFSALMTDDALCGCQLIGSGRMADDPVSPTGTGASKIVELPAIVSSCADRSKIFAKPGQKMSTASQSFVVKRTAIRDLRPTGRRNKATGALDEYMGAVYIEFDTGSNLGRALRGIKASKLFTTTPDGMQLVSCTADNTATRCEQVTNSPLFKTYASSFASCNPPGLKGYTIVSGGFRTDGRLPTCPSKTNSQVPAILESRPIVKKNGEHGWLVTATCQTIQAIAICKRGR